MLQVVPHALRRRYWLFVLGLSAAGAWIWFGWSGVALIALWARARMPWRVAAFRIPLEPPGMIPVSVGPWRVTVHVAGCRREVFRDEVTRAQWAELLSCARLGSTQLAAGWRTSSGSP